MASRKDPLLWHGKRSVRIQKVTRQHKTCCVDCRKMPSTLRLVVTDGAGRGATTTVRCDLCGIPWLEERAAEAARAITALKNGTGSIRL